MPGLVAGERGDGQQRERADASGSGKRVRQPVDCHVDEGEGNSEQGQPGQGSQLPCRGSSGGHDCQGEPGGKLGQKRARADPGTAGGAAPGDGQERSPGPVVQHDLAGAGRAGAAGRLAGFGAAGEHAGAYPRADDQASGGPGDDPGQCHRVPPLLPRRGRAAHGSPGAQAD
jgi:hypothetical protein